MRLVSAWGQLDGAALSVSSLLGLGTPVGPGDMLFLRACVGDRFAGMAPSDLAVRRSALMAAADRYFSSSRTPLLEMDPVDTWQDEPEPTRTAYAVVLMLSAAAVVSSSPAGDLVSVMSHAPAFVSAFDTQDRCVAHRLVESAVKLASMVCPSTDPVAVVRALTDCWSRADEAVGVLASSVLVFDEVVELSAVLTQVASPVSRAGMLLVAEMCDEAKRSTPDLRATVAALARHVAESGSSRDRCAQAAFLCPGVPDHRELSGSVPSVAAFLETLFLNRVAAVENGFGAVGFAQYVRNVWVQYIDEMLERTVSRRVTGAFSWDLLSFEFESVLRSWVSVCLREFPAEPVQ